MRNTLRAGVLVAVAAGFLFALGAIGSSASADVVEPKSAFQPASVKLLEEEAAKAAVPLDAAPADAGATVDPAADEAKPVKADEVVVPTPAPEQVVRQVPPHLVRTNDSPSVVERVMHPLRMGFQQIGASLGRAVGACEVVMGGGAGGPALVFAVLAMVAPFIRRRTFGVRRTADEDVPEFLFARELTPPG